MTTRWFGAPVQRVEDDRLLRGRGRFTDDIDEGALECCFVRSPHAHARITSIDVNEARAMPGVAAVYTAADLPFGGLDLPLLIPHPNLTHGRTQRCLASEIVRYAGEAVAFVVATDRYVAEDAAELVAVDYEPLPVVITPEAAARAEHLVHDDVPGNVAAEMLQEVGDVDAAMRTAARRKQMRFRYEHFTAVNQERGQVHEVEVGFDDDGRVLALSDDFIHDGGAYTPYGIILPIITAAQLPGPYRLRNYRVRFRDLYTNAV